MKNKKQIRSLTIWNMLLSPLPTKIAENANFVYVPYSNGANQVIFKLNM